MAFTVQNGTWVVVENILFLDFTYRMQGRPLTLKDQSSQLFNTIYQMNSADPHL